METDAAAMEQFWEDLETGELHVRDRWQFALKSDFIPETDQKFHQYVQEFYLFIPNSLQINKNTYSKGQFFIDQTTLIRYKTPEFTFGELMNLHDPRSPLTRLFILCNKLDTPENRKQFSDELKLLANIVRSTMRREVKTLVYLLNGKSTSTKNQFIEKAQQLCHAIEHLREAYSSLERQFLNSWKDPVFYRQLLYIDEFISDTISRYISGLLENLRLTENEGLNSIEDSLCNILIEEQRLSELFGRGSTFASGKVDTKEGETIVYRESLLNKFILDALYLATNRFSLDQQYQHWIGGLAAGIAMTLYLSFFVWLGNVFLINSVPFVVLMIIVYVLKDRIKEWVRILSYQHASRWFPDYTTIIKSPQDNTNIGILKESFTFLDQPQLPQELKNVRNAEFHTVLETFQRPESVLFYKRIVEISKLAKEQDHRRYGLNIIFRFNIHRFLRKASDPVETHLIIDPATRKLLSIRLPKVYHLNLIIRSTLYRKDLPPSVELKKLRVIIDKNGIKRIEQVVRR